MIICGYNYVINCVCLTIYMWWNVTNFARPRYLFPWTPHLALLYKLCHIKINTTIRITLPPFFWQCKHTLNNTVGPDLTSSLTGIMLLLHVMPFPYLVFPETFKILWCKQIFLLWLIMTHLVYSVQNLQQHCIQWYKYAYVMLHSDQKDLEWCLEYIISRFD